MFHPDDISLLSGVGVGSISSNNSVASLMKFILPNSSVSLVNQPFLWPPITKIEAKSKINKCKDDNENESDYVYDEERSNLSNLLDIINLSQNLDELFQPTLLIPHPIVIKPKYEKEFLNINDAIITDFIVPSIKNALHEFPEKMPLLFEHLEKFIESTDANPNDCDIAFASGVSEILFESIFSTHYDTQTLANILNSCIKFIIQFGSSIDCFLLAQAWIQSSPKPIIKLDWLADEIGYRRFPSVLPSMSEGDGSQRMPLIHFFNDLSNLKISMYSGYLFVAGKNFGVVKVGTGYEGTIPGSFVCRNISLSKFSSKFLCIINNIVIYGAYINDEENSNENCFVFYLDAITLKILKTKKENSPNFNYTLLSDNRLIYKHDWKGKITVFTLKDNNTDMEEKSTIDTDFRAMQYTHHHKSDDEDDNSSSDNDGDFTYGAIDEFTNGINYYIFYSNCIIEIDLYDGKSRMISIFRKAAQIKYRYVFDPITTHFYIIDDQGLSIISENTTYGRINPPSKDVLTPFDIIHFLTYQHHNLQSRFALSPSFNLLFPLIQSIVPVKKANQKQESNAVKKPSMPPPEFIPSPRTNSSASKKFPTQFYEGYTDYSPILLEASTQSLKNGNVLSDELFPIFLDRLDFFYENYPIVTLAFLATYLTSEETASKSEIIFQNKIDFSILFEAASQLPCLHQAYVFHFLSDEKCLKAIWNLFENLDHKAVAFLNVLSESLAYLLIKDASDVIPYIQSFIELIHYSQSPLFYSFLESFFYVFQRVSSSCPESIEMLIRVLPFLSDPMKVNTINDFSMDSDSNDDKLLTVNKTDALSLNNSLLSSDIPISTCQESKVSRLVRIFDLELPITSKIYLKFNFQNKITCDQVCLFVYTTKSQKEHEAFLPKSGSPPTDKIEAEFNSSYIAVDVDVIENNNKDTSNDENGNSNNTIEFVYSLSCTIPILTATDTLMNMNVFQLYWCKALMMVKGSLLKLSKKSIEHDSSVKQNNTQQLFDVVFQNIPHDIYHKIFYRFRNIEINLINTEKNIKFIRNKLSSKNFNERLFYLSMASRLLDSFSIDELMKNWRELFITFSFVMNHKKNIQEIEDEQQIFNKILQNHQTSSLSNRFVQTKDKYFKLKSNVDFGFKLDLNLHLDCFISISDFQKYADNQFYYIIQSIIKSDQNNQTKRNQIEIISKIIIDLMNMIDQSSIPIITSNMTIISKAILLLPNDSKSSLIDKNFIKNLILSHLTKCIDDSLELVFLYENIFNKFDIKIDEIDDNVKNILESVEVTQGNLENKYYSQCCRFLRHFMTENAFNKLVNFIDQIEPLPVLNNKNNSDEDNDSNGSIENDITCYNYKGSCLGALMILSSRYSPLSINDKYIMCSNRDKNLYDLQAAADSNCKDNINLFVNDYNSLIFSFETDDGMIVSHPPFDFYSYLPIFDNSFYKKVLENPLPKLSSALIKNVIKQLNGKYKPLAIDALCDLSINSFVEPLQNLDYLEKSNFIQKIILDDNENYMLEIEKKPTPHFVIDENIATNLVEMQDAYKTDSIKRSKFKKSKEFSIFLRSFFSAKHKHVNVVFFDQPGTDFKIILSRFDKYKLLLNDDHNREICIWSITDHFIASVLPGSKSSVIECYFGISPEFQIVYLKLGSHFWVNPVQYTPDIKKVRLGIVGDEYTFDAFVIDEPPDLLIPTFTPRYLLIDNSIKSFEKFEKKSKKLENDISLLPFLKNEGQLFYMEVTYNCKHMKFYLSPSFMLPLQFYSFDFPTVENGAANQTIGITIDFMQNIVGIKSDNKIIKESVMSFDYLPYVCLHFHHDEGKVIEFNFGSKPFLYLFKTIPVKSTKHCVVEYTNDDSNDVYTTYHFTPTIQTPFKPTGLSFPIEIGRPAFLHKNSKPLLGMIRNDRFLTSTFSTTIPLLSPLIKDLKDSFISLDLTASSSSNYLNKNEIASAKNQQQDIESSNEEDQNDIVYSSSFVDFFTNDNNRSIKTKSTNSFNDLMLWSTPFDSVDNVEIATVHSLFFLRDRINPEYHKEFSRLARQALNEYDGNFCNPHNLTIKNYELDLTHKSETIINIFMNLIKNNDDILEYFNNFDSFYSKLLLKSIDNLSTVDLHTDYPFSNLLFELIKMNNSKSKIKCGNIEFVKHYLIESSKMFTNIQSLIDENGKYRSIHGNSIGNFERISDLECDAVIFLTTRIGNNKNSKIKLVDKYQNKISLKAFYDHKINLIDYKTNYNCIQTLLRSEFIFSRIKYHDAIMCCFVPIDFKHPENLNYDEMHSFRSFYCNIHKKKKELNKINSRLESVDKEKNENTNKSAIKYCNRVGFAFAIHFINHVYEYIKQSNDKIIANMFNKYFLRPVFYELVYKKVCVFDRYVAKWMSILITHRNLFTEKTIVSYKSVKELSFEQFQFDQCPYNELSYVVHLIMMTGDCYVSKYVLNLEYDLDIKRRSNAYKKYERSCEKEQIIKENYRDIDKYNYDYSSDDEFEENGLFFSNYYIEKTKLDKLDVIDEIDEIEEVATPSNEIDEIKEVTTLLNKEREENEEDDSFDSQILQEQRKRISKAFIIDRSFSKRAISIYKIVAAELLNPLGCHIPFFCDLFKFPYLTSIITNEFFKWRPDLMPPTILLSSISPNYPYIHKAKKFSIPIIYGNPPPSFRIQGYECSSVDHSFFELTLNGKEKNKEKQNENGKLIRNESDSNNESDDDVEAKSDDDGQIESEEKNKNKKKQEKLALLKDFGYNNNDENDDYENYRYFIISNPSNLPIPMRFQISFLSEFTEAKNLPDGRKLNQINLWLCELKAKWNLKYEAICFFIHTLLQSFKCSIVNFKVFEPIIKNIFPTISTNASLLQLMLTSFRMRSGFNFKPIYNYQLEDDLEFISNISPDPIKIPKDCYKRRSTISTVIGDSTESTATAVTTTISSEISSVASAITHPNTNNNNNNINDIDDSNLSLESINNNNNNNDDENGLSSIQTNRSRSRNESASSSNFASRSQSQNSSLSNFNLNINPDLSFIGSKSSAALCTTNLSLDSSGKHLSDFYISASKSFDFCFPHNYKEFVPLTENILTSYTENDLFTNNHDHLFSKKVASEWETPAYLPRSTACGKKELEAFSAFGTHLVVSFEIGASVPFIVSRVVIRYAFDYKLILDDFADVDIEFATNGKEEMIAEKIRPIKKQLDAIRIGVLKMRPIKYHSYFKLDYFPRVVQMMPFVDILQLMEENPNIKPFIVFKSVLAILDGLKERGKRIQITKNCII